MAAPSYVFVVPDPGAVVSGGHIYNARLSAALRGRGVDVRVADRATLSADPPHEESVCLVDTLYLEDLDDLPLRIGEAQLIVHHLGSLDPEDGRSSETVFEEDERSVLDRFAGFLVTSTFTAGYLESKGYAPARIRVVPPAAGSPLRTTLDVHDPVRVLLVANLVSRKGILPFLQSLRGAAGLRVRVVGGYDLEPEYAARCRELVARELSDTVELVGTVAADRMPAEYAAADLFVSAASMETFGMALAEAAAAAVPIFAVDGGHVASHVDDGITGRLFPDARALAWGVAEACRDVGALAGMKHAAGQREGVALASWDEVAARFLREFATT